MADKILAWSYSRWDTYRKCPFLAKCKFVLKLKEPGSEAMDRGTGIHKKLETYLAGRARGFPREAVLLKETYVELKKAKPRTELEITFNSKWELTQWMGRDAWCRIKVDALVLPKVENPVVKVVDHKTGKLKEYGEYDEQLELYGLAGLLSFPIAEKAEAKLLFVDAGKEVPCEPFLRKDVEKLKKKWELRVTPMLKDEKFKPTPGHACKWCHFRKDNGGPCKF